MPAGDATGPAGQGPMTGRGLGGCVPASAPATEVNNSSAGTQTRPGVQSTGQAAPQMQNSAPAMGGLRPRRFFRAMGRGFRGGRGGRGRGRVRR
ncbi:MAG: DUF5320 domain-containing protein [bacterium]